MRYRNIITGEEFETKSICSAPKWELVGAEQTPPKEPEVEKPKEMPVEKKTTKTTASKSTKKPAKRSKK